MNILAGKNHRHEARNAYTLIEVVGAMVMVVMIISVSLPVLSRLHRGKSAIAREVAWQHSIGPLGESFRHDAHSAASAEVQNMSMVLRSKDGSTTTYEFSSGEICRTRVVNGKTFREGFSLSEDSQVDWEISGAKNNMAVLRLNIPTVERSMVPRPSDANPVTRALELHALLANMEDGA